MPRGLPFNPKLPQPAARWGKLFLLGGLTGILAGAAAAGLNSSLEHGVRLLIGRFNLHIEGAEVWTFNWGVLLLPVIGGLLSGLLVHWLSPKEHEHGINQLIGAFHNHGGNLNFRGPAVKAVAAIGTISFGGSAGPEAPIANLGAAIGSNIARLLRLSARERRILLVAGCGGGVGAIFQCPLGGALFATSVLYQEPEFDADSIVPSFVSSVLSYSTFISLLGEGGPMLGGANQLFFSRPLELIPYAVLGPICGLLSILFYYCFRLIENRPLGRLHLPRWLAPALGGLCVGLIGCALPQVMDGQYGFVRNVMSGLLFAQPGAAGKTWWDWTILFGAIAVFKCVATALTVGSGASGGALGPSVFIGGAAGAFLGALIETLFPGVLPPEQMEMLRRSLIPVGMAGVLAAGMRTPMAAIVMVTEMTGSYGLIVPLMLVCAISYVVGRRWGLNSAQVRSAADSPAHAGDLLVHTLQAMRVRDVMNPRWPYRVHSSTTLGEMVASVRSGSRPIFAVVDRGRLIGIVSLSDISRVISEPGISDIVIAADIMTSQITVVPPDRSLYEVVDLFKTAGQEILPVVHSPADMRYVGMVRRQAIFEMIRSRFTEMRGHLHREHAGIAAFEQDEQLYQLVLGVSAPQPDTIHHMPVPSDVVGKSIRDSNFGREYKAQVIGIVNADGRLQCPPDIDTPLRADQLLVVIVAPQSGTAETAPENEEEQSASSE